MTNLSGWLMLAAAELHPEADATQACLFSTVARHANGAVKTVLERKLLSTNLEF